MMIMMMMMMVVVVMMMMIMMVMMMVMMMVVVVMMMMIMMMMMLWSIRSVTWATRGPEAGCTWACVRDVTVTVTRTSVRLSTDSAL